MVPTLMVPTLMVPTLTVPTLTVPTLMVATLTVPTLMVPTLTVPTLTVPILTVPTLTVPTLMLHTLTVPKTVPNGADQCQPPDGAPWSTKCPFKHPFKKKAEMSPDPDPDSGSKPESRGPQGALGGLICNLKIPAFSLLYLRESVDLMQVFSWVENISTRYSTFRPKTEP